MSLKFVPQCPINNMPTLFQIMAWCRMSSKALSKPKMALFTYVSLGLNELIIHAWVTIYNYYHLLGFYWICLIENLILNTLWPSDIIWWQGSRSTLAQAMACCLTAPSHYLNQCWLMISEVLWHSPDKNVHRKYLRYLSLKWVWNLLIWDCSQIPQGSMS